MVQPIRPPMRKAHPSNSNGAATMADDETCFRLTDTGNAERLVALYGDRVRYCVPLRKWLVWDETRWTVDTRGQLMALAKQVARSIYAEAARCADDDIRKAIVAWARKSESRGARAAMVELAQSEPGVAVLPGELDADPWALNTTTCTVDLRTGMPRPHRREDMITKCAAAGYDGGARSTLWERILSEAMNTDVVAYLQRSAGYACTGLTSEEKLFMFVGPAATSKSTIIQAITKTLGDYAKTADFEAFIAKKNDGGPRNDIARLAGARFVCSIEVDKGKHLAQGLLKTLTGGDVVSARFLYSEAFEFLPTFKLWLVCNDAPKVDDEDSGMWRRLESIPLVHIVPEDKRDPEVKKELTDPARSGAAILAWLVEGCLQWQAKGLGTPAVVRQATAEYRSDQDPLKTFIEETCFLDAAVQCARRALRDGYEVWAREAGGRVPLTGHAFNERVRKLNGVGEKIIKGTRYWTGIGLVAKASDHYRPGCGVQEGARES